MTLTDFLLARIAEDEEAIQRDEACCETFTIEPGRMLAECDARRRIVSYGGSRLPLGKGDDLESGASIAMDLVLRALASAYADHPDYREEWKP